jgi:uncharacterized damage-inducible protein DinB
MNPTPQDIARLFAYTRWASGKTLESVEPLTEEEFRKPVGGSFGSVHGTLAHLYGADAIWFERWHGHSPRALPDPEKVPTLADVRREWGSIQEEQRKFVEALTPEKIAGELRYEGFDAKPYRRVFGDALVHLVNHGTYHRGQVATLLRQLGKQAISTDFLRYVDAGG